MNQQESIQQLVNTAMSFHGKGDWQRADGLYQQVLEKDPKNAIAWHWRGVIALQTGQLDVAEDLIGKALGLAPDYTEARVNLGNVLQARQDYPGAIGCFEQALEQDPDSARLLANLGNAYLQMGLYSQAIERYRKALVLDGQLLETQRNLAMALVKTGQLPQAWQVISGASLQQPDAIEIAFSKGIILREMGKPRAALECFQSLQSRLPDFAPLLNNLGNALKDCGQLSAAKDHYLRAITADPAFADAHLNLGTLYQENGERDQALASLRRAIKYKPAYGKAHRLLAGLKHYSERDNDLNHMVDLLKSRSTTAEDSMHLHFGLGKAYEDLADFDSAFNHIDQANQLQRDMSSYSLPSDIRLFRNIKSTFSSALLERLAATGDHSDLPIFVVGMPRSGTSLVEQILASHPDVHGGGELNVLPECLASHYRLDAGVDYTQQFKRSDATTLRAVAAEYLHRIGELAPGARHIVDKLPINFLNVGLIRLMLPNAKIIHCRREPLDTCLSIYKHYFPDLGHGYSCDQTVLGEYYTLYRGLMEHWETLFPGDIYHLHYEKLVSDQEGQTRNLLAACDLPWDEQCLSFFTTKRTVQTLSASQVRRPIYATSVKLSRSYEKHLQPLMSILGS